MGGLRAAGVIGGFAALSVLAGCCPDGSLSITVEGFTRTYQIYMPDADPTEPVPLVVALHPLLLNGGQMRRLTGFDEIAAREGFAVAYPDGISRRWDVLTPGDRDWKFISALIDQLLATHNIDPTRVYAVGASNGAMMCHLLASKIPQKLAAIATVMGTPPQHVLDACPENTQMPVLIIHGSEDPIVPYNGQQGWYGFVSVPAAAEFWAGRNGCQGEPSPTPLPDTAPNDGTTVDLIEYGCPETEPVLLYRVNGGGHTWPGARAFFPEWVTGRVSRDFEASEAIWQFFQGRRTND